MLSVSLVFSEGASTVSFWREEAANLGFSWRYVRVAMEETCFLIWTLKWGQWLAGRENGVDTGSEGKKQLYLWKKRT